MGFLKWRVLRTKKCGRCNTLLRMKDMIKVIGPRVILKAVCSWSLVLVRQVTAICWVPNAVFFPFGLWKWHKGLVKEYDINHVLAVITFVGVVGLIFHQLWLFKAYNSKLNFRKFKVALNLMHRIFCNFAKRCVLSCLSKVDNIKKFHLAVFEL